VHLPDRDEFHDELTNDELDAILAGVHQNLLAYAHSVASPVNAFAAIMAHSDTDVTSADTSFRPTINTLTEQRIWAVVQMRRRSAQLHDELKRVIARARDVAIDLDRALDERSELVIALKAARAFARSHDKQLTEFLDHARDLVFTITRDLIAVRRLDRDLAADRDRMVRQELALDVNSVQTFDGIRELDRILSRNREDNIDRQIEAASQLSIDLDRTSRISRTRATDHNLDRGRARQLAIAIDVALVRSRELTYDVRHRLDMLEVNASGADLSNMWVVDPETLIGVIWSEDTTWPPCLADRVRILSYPLSDGVYQVRRGGQRHARELVPV
jgi:hypothetical protein